MNNFKVEAYIEYQYEDSSYQAMDTFYVSSSNNIDLNYINTLVKSRTKDFDSVDIVVSKLSGNEPLN